MKLKLLSIFLLISPLALGQVKMNLASDVWPPFTNVKEEQSLAFDIVHEALSRSYVSAESHITTFEDVMTGISDGTYDGSAALWKSTEREESLIFSQPYLQNQLILVGRKGQDVSATDLKDLAGKRVAVVETYSYGDMLQMTDAEFIYGESDQENLSKLLNEEADYMLADRLLISFMINYQGEEVATYLEIGEHTLMTKSLHFAIRRDFPDARGIVQRFNEAILKMTADGTYNKLLGLNWISTDVDGDGHMEYVLNGNAGDQAPSNSYSVWFNNSNGTSDTSSRYYIEGKYYNSWNEVPEKYKTPVAPGTPDNFTFMKFNIK